MVFSGIQTMCFKVFNSGLIPTDNALLAQGNCIPTNTPTPLNTHLNNDMHARMHARMSAHMHTRLLQWLR